MSWLSSFLHPERGYQAGQDQLNKYYNDAQGHLKPYVEHGEQSYGGLSEAMKQLLNPQALQDKWSKGYTESDMAKNAEAMATEHGLNSASSLGLMGSTPALQAIQAGTSQIGAQDKQQYMNDLMQKYMQGAGLAKDIYGTGANAANNMSNNAMNMGNNSAQMAFGQQNAPGNMLSKLLEAFTSFGMPFAQNWAMNKMGGNNAWSTGGA